MQHRRTGVAGRLGQPAVAALAAVRAGQHPARLVGCRAVHETQHVLVGPHLAGLVAELGRYGGLVVGALRLPGTQRLDGAARQPGWSVANAATAGAPSTDATADHGP